MRTADYDYELPQEAIAQRPAEPRGSTRLLLAVNPAEPPVHSRISDLPAYLAEGDVVVLNETRVLPARLRLRKETGGEVEVLLLEQLDSGAWTALVRPGRRVGVSAVLVAPDGTPVVEVGEASEGGQRVVRLLAEPWRYGTVPLPPYIRETLTDADRYQTVYARAPGSVAAPTAGLHLTDALLQEIRARGAEVHTIDLAIGLGTFRPITADRVEDHVMHEERYDVPEATRDACRRARRVVAVGTTALRALESAAASGQPAGRTRLFIRPGYRFKVVDLLLTNFHQPRSSLLVLLAAFAGEPRWRRLYDEALRCGYRFLSFGDAMLVGRGDGGLVGRG